MSWCEDLNNNEVDCFIIEFANAKFFCELEHYFATGALKPMLRLDFPLVMAHVKSSYEDST